MFRSKLNKTTYFLENIRIRACGALHRYMYNGILLGINNLRVKKDCIQMMMMMMIMC